ncbi:MAG: phospholipid/cholesterol/gamma-HCH transport system substrate-binding protein [Thermoleophilaceae bacterium]|nr:phospholipid/cholesterol/gamma-HCH transport system substrate-binding protein [Thermoleophilaceae bacterium]
MNLRKALRFYARHVVALTAIVLLSLAVSTYIVVHQRLRFPWEKEFIVYAQFSNAQAVTPGQGQTVNVAGVEVGEITGVKLENGLAVVEMNITSPDLHAIYSNAHMLLRPKTGLNDMSIALDPGSPDPSLPDDGKLAAGATLPVWNTLPAVNPDEVLSALDGDTRNYLATVANAGGQGLKGRGPDLRALVAASEPTFAHTKRIMHALADRRQKLTRLVTNLRLLSEASASKDRELASLVSGSTASFETIAGREAELGATLDRLPGALGATDRALTTTRALAVDLEPSLSALRPTIRGLGPALVDVRPLLSDATPLLRDKLRPLVRQATPVVHELRPSLKLLNSSEPDLERATDVLTYVVNELGYNPPGAQEGYLFWVAWFIHNSASIVSIEDAHGVAWRGLVMGSCSTFGQVIAANPALAPLGQAAFCGTTGTPGGGVPLPKKKAKGGR